MRKVTTPINCKEFLDDVEELHALVIGLCEVLCPWPPMFKGPPSSDSVLINNEYHYYMLGRALGILAWIAISCGIKELFF